MGLFAKPGQWMELNPDYRRSAPRCGLFCCRCQKPLKEQGGMTHKVVEVNHDTLQVRSNPMGKDLIGEDCWKEVLKENKVVL